MNSTITASDNIPSHKAKLHQEILGASGGFYMQPSPFSEYNLNANSNTYHVLVRFPSSTSYSNYSRRWHMATQDVIEKVRVYRKWYFLWMA